MCQRSGKCLWDVSELVTEVGNECGADEKLLPLYLRLLAAVVVSPAAYDDGTVVVIVDDSDDDDIC